MADVTHAKTSGLPADEGNSAHVEPTDWYADHTIGTGLTLNAALAGTSFPGSPATGRRFFRTDRGLDYYYDGTRWLTVQMFTWSFYNNSISAGINLRIAPSQAYDTWVERIDATDFTGSTRNGSNFWKFEVRKLTNGAGTGTVIGTATDNSGTASQWSLVNATISALVDRATYGEMDVQVTLSGSPGNATQGITVFYRLVG